MHADGVNPRSPACVFTLQKGGVALHMRVSLRASNGHRVAAASTDGSVTASGVSGPGGGAEEERWEVKPAWPVLRQQTGDLFEEMFSPRQPQQPTPRQPQQTNWAAGHDRHGHTEVFTPQAVPADASAEARAEHAQQSALWAAQRDEGGACVAPVWLRTRQGGHLTAETTGLVHARAQSVGVAQYFWLVTPDEEQARCDASRARVAVAAAASRAASAAEREKVAEQQHETLVRQREAEARVILAAAVVAEAERVVTAAQPLPDVAQPPSVAVDEEAMRSNAIRDVHLADIQRMERLRTSKLWQGVQECAREFESALLHTGFTRDQLPRWRSCLTAAFAELRKMDADTDGMACAGMPSLPADLEAVRSKRKAFRALIDQDLARVTQLLKACDDLAALIRTTGWLHHETPLEAPSV